MLFERFCPSVADDLVLKEHYARFQRESASPGAAVSYLRSLMELDVRPVLPKIRSPTLVLHATGDVTDPVERARDMAARIPYAEMVELDSCDHLIWLTDALDSMVNEIRDFVVRVAPDRRRATAPVTGSSWPPSWRWTSPPSRPRTWRPSSSSGTRARVRRDDGIIAAFDGAARAVRCAEAIVGDHAVNGALRAGLHSGECDVNRRRDERRHGPYRPEHDQARPGRLRGRVPDGPRPRRRLRHHLRRPRLARRGGRADTAGAPTSSPAPDRARRAGSPMPAAGRPGGGRARRGVEHA